MTAMLVAPEDARGRPEGISATIARDEIEEALASDAPLDLVLDVMRPIEGGSETASVKVTWQRDDLESLLSRIDSDGITFTFDRGELERALEEDFEGHGLREMVLLTVAAASASAAVAVSTASGQLIEGTSTGGPAAVLVAPGHDEATTARDLAAAAAPDVDVAIATAMAAQATGHDEATLAQRGIEPSTPVSAVGTGDATTARDLAAPSHDEATLVSRGVVDLASTADEATLAERGIEAGTVAASHDEATLASRGIGVTAIATDEASLAARGIDPQPLPASHDEATLVGRGIEAPPAVDSGSSFELPSVDPGTAAAIGGLAGAGLVIVAAGFLARRQRMGAA